MVNDRRAKGKTPPADAPAGEDRSVPVDVPAVDHILYLHEMLQRRFNREMGELLDPSGDPALRPSHRRILQLIPRDGCRPTTLAQRADLTKQSVAELLAHLDAHGYVVQAPDERDRRAIRVRRSAAGDEAVRRTASAIAALEDRWRHEVGAERYESLRTVLTELIEPVALHEW